MIKLKLNEKNKLSSAVLLILLILIIVGVLSFMILGLLHFNLLDLELPEFIQNLFPKSDNTPMQIKNDDRDIYNFLESTASDVSEIESNEIFTFDITLENIREVIGNIILPDNLYIESRAEYYYKNEATKIVETSLWKKGEKFRYLVRVNSRNETLYINDGKKEYIQDFIVNNSIIKDADELFSFSNIPNIQDINYYLDLLEDSRIINYAPKQNSDESIAHIKYDIPGLNQREIIYVSLDTGIVLEVRSDYGNENTLYYKYKATVKEAYNDGAEISKTDILDRLFVINQN